MIKRPLIVVVSLIGLLGMSVTVSAVASENGPLASTRQPAATSIKLTWSAAFGPVPGAATTLPPAITVITFPGWKPAALVLWSGPSAGKLGNKISYVSATASLSHNKWTAPATVDNGKVFTDQGPAAAPYGAPAGAPSRGHLLVAWKATGPTGKILYTVGTGLKTDGLSWGPAKAIPGATSASAPALLSPMHSSTVIAAWRAPGNQLTYVVGVVPPAPGAPIHWGNPATISGARTTAAPALAEANTGSHSGTVYLFWRTSSGRIERSSIPDPVPLHPTWTTPVAFPSSVKAGTGPAAASLGINYAYPLLVVYRAAQGSSLSYVQLPLSGKVTKPVTVPGLHSMVQPALGDPVLFVTESIKRLAFKLSKPCWWCDPH